jgi:hypothetical protein
MKLAKCFIYLTFLLAFALDVLGQTEAERIVWKNLQKQYEKVEDIKPVISINGINHIYVSSAYNLGTLFKFNEATNEWESRDPILCGYATARLTTYKLNSNKQIVVNFDRVIISRGMMSEFMRPLEPEPIRKGIYKFRLYYGLGKSKINLVSDSPEFEVIEYKPE